MTATVQRSFAGGEISPALYARADMAKYNSGLRTCMNFIVQKHGGVANRPGFQYVAEVKDSTKQINLVEFIFNDSQTYILEFGEYYMRVFKDGAVVDATGIVAWVITTAYNQGDIVSNGGTNYYCTVAHTSSATDEPGVGANWADYWHAMTGTIFELETPYTETECQEIRFVQSADVITIVHPSYPPQKLSRYADDDWVLTEMSFVPLMDYPTGVNVTPGAAGANTYRYRVTAANEDNYQESLPGLEAADTITGVTQANPAVVTVSVANDYQDDDVVYIDGIVGMTELNGRYFRINQLTTTTFELVGEDSTAYTAYSSGGSSYRNNCMTTVAATPTTSAPNVIAWTEVSGAIEYYIYKEVNGVFGYIGTATGSSFNDDNITPDTSIVHPTYNNPFEGTDNYPSAVSYYQQRQIFASTNNDPEKIWASRSADYYNFTKRSPLQDDDAMSWLIAGREVNSVRHMLEIDKFLVLTTGGEWLVEGDVDGILKPGLVNPRQQGHNGSSTLRPITVGNVAIYVQARGGVIRDLKSEGEKGYQGSDLTVFANHLFEGHTIVSWTYQQIPNSVIWAVRDDGVLLGLTYLPEHEIWGWHRHETDGFVENVACVPEGTEDRLYLVIKRTINGSDVRYIESMQSRMVTDIAIDAFFVDSGLTYDGRNTGATTMTLTTATTWSYTEDLTLTASAAFFSAADVGNAIVLKEVDTDGTILQDLHCTILSYTSTTVVTVQANRNVPTAFQAVAISDWGKAVDEVTGLDHLEGKLVSILADGNVETQDTVSSGTLTLARPYEIIHVGLPYNSDFETLDLDTPDGETLINKKKIVNGLTVQLQASRGIWAGPDADHLRELPQREYEDWGDPTTLKTGKVELALNSEFNDNGRTFLRQADPLPLTILAVVPEGGISQ